MNCCYKSDLLHSTKAGIFSTWSLLDLQNLKTSYIFADGQFWETPCYESDVICNDIVCLDFKLNKHLFVLLFANCNTAKIDFS